MTAILGEGKIKGSVLLARLEFIKEHGGDRTLQAVLGKLSEVDREVFTGMILPVSWYDIRLELRLDMAIAAVISPNDPARPFLAMGRSSAEKNLAQYQSDFVEVGNPHRVLSRAPQLYRLYYDAGRRTYEKLDERKAVLRTFEAPTVTVEDCLTIVGWHERAIEISGGKAVDVKETKCRTRGHDHCEYLCEWS
jgi:predicted hydrocarbon binding protein